MSWAVKLAEKAIAWCEHESRQKERVFCITGTSKDDIYLIRYTLLKTKWCCIYLHRFLRSDRDDFHDHPWNFASWLLKGEYDEYRQHKACKERCWHYTRRTTSRNSFILRKATTAHKVMVGKHLTWPEREQAPLTLFIGGRRKREWGFITHQGKWIQWQEYLNIPKRQEAK